VVLDNLNTHLTASMYAAFSSIRGTTVGSQAGVPPHAPKHGSWLNVAECQLAVLASQCLNQRLPDLATVLSEVAAWERQRNAERPKRQMAFHHCSGSPKAQAGLPRPGVNQHGRPLVAPSAQTLQRRHAATGTQAITHPEGRLLRKAACTLTRRGRKEEARKGVPAATRGSPGRSPPRYGKRCSLTRSRWRICPNTHPSAHESGRLMGACRKQLEVLQQRTTNWNVRRIRRRERTETVTDSGQQFGQLVALLDRMFRVKSGSRLTAAV
jgi:hypothetical protein